MGKNIVGCMIGFYVYSASEQPSKDGMIPNVLGEGTKFVPWNEITEEFYLSGTKNPDGYMIMCATYEPQKSGPFMISV